METATPLFFSSNPGGAVLDNVVVKPLSLLLTNGSFEVGPLSSTTLNTGDTSMAPWTVGGSGVTFQRSDVGQAYLYLNSSSGPGSISQDIATIPGEVYQVSFNMGGGSGFPISLRSLQVQAAGQTQDFLSIALTRKQWTFKANAATTTLTFQSLNSGPLGASLDKVEVVHPGNPVLNGSFEKNSYVIPPAPFYLLSYGSARITYWTVGGPSLDYIPAAYWQTSQGGFSIDLNGIATGSIEQTFLTTPGVDYRVTFALAGNPEDGPAVKNLRVTAAGRSQDYTFDTTGKSVTNMGWTNKTFSFTAQWPTTTLSFQSLTNGTNAGPALDNVRLSKVRGLPPLMLLLD
jgi:choice-of-anchor C domain-containing protein